MMPRVLETKRGVRFVVSRDVLASAAEFDGHMTTFVAVDSCSVVWSRIRNNEQKEDYSSRFANNDAPCDVLIKNS